MSQYLAIGLSTSFNFSKKEMENHKILKEEVIENMQKKHQFDPSIYDEIEEESFYCFKLKPEILEEQLIPFLKELYPLLYPKDSSYYKETLENLEDMPPGQYLKFAEGKPYESYQKDPYGESDYMYFDKPLQPYITINYSSLMFSMEGKIVMETYGRQFNFFNHCLITSFPEFSLAKAMRVYLTG